MKLLCLLYTHTRTRKRDILKFNERLRHYIGIKIYVGKTKFTSWLVRLFAEISQHVVALATTINRIHGIDRKGKPN